MYQEKYLRKYNELPYKNNILFVVNEYSKYDWVILIKLFKNRFQCRITTTFADMKGNRY